MSFWKINEIALLLITVAVFLAVTEIGFRLGRRRSSDGALHNHVNALQGALLGLLALLLGFTFAMAMTRYDTRKELVLEEANAIGTTYLRTQFLPEPQRRQAQELLKAYVNARLAFYEAGTDPARLQTANETSAHIDNRIWAVAIEAAEQDRMSVLTGLFLQALNDMIDLNEKRRVAFDNHVPETVIYLLLAVSFGALGFIAYGSGLAGSPRHASTVIFAFLIALVLVTILDMDRPRRGLIRVSQASMLRLQQALAPSAP